MFGITKLALADGSPEVAITALLLATQLRGTEAVEIYSSIPFLDDASARQVGIEAIRELVSADRLDTYRKVIASAQGTDLGTVIGDLALEANKPAFEIILEGYAHSDEEIRTQLNHTTRRLVGREFESLDQARAWWSASSTRYNEKLYEVVPR